MGLLHLLPFDLDRHNVAAICLFAVGAAFFSRLIYIQYFHPLSQFYGPWYLSFTSAMFAVICLTPYEPEFFVYLMKKYGSDGPIRVTPNTLFFPSPSALKDIYREPSMNHKSKTYGSGVLGPPSLFSILPGEQHRVLRKAVSNAPWTIGPFRNSWEARIDDLIRVFLGKMDEHVAEKRTICLSDKVAEFALDFLGTIAFGSPFGAVEKQRDEKKILENWRDGLGLFGFAGRSRTFRNILNMPYIGSLFLPKTSNSHGMGWLIREADRQITNREQENSEKPFEGQPDFLQHCLEARFSDASPLTPEQKRAHVTLLIQAGADTTATAMGSTLRFLVTHPDCLQCVRTEIDKADQAGSLSHPIQYEETRIHLPYFTACLKESLRLNPPATSFFSRIVPPGGKTVDGHFVPGGMEVFCNPYGIQRNREFYGEDAELFKPERWMEGEKRRSELEGAQFTFGMGYRVCIGREISMMEMSKVLPEIIRNYDIQLVKPGYYHAKGGVAYNVDFLVKLSTRGHSNTT